MRYLENLHCKTIPSIAKATEANAIESEKAEESASD